LPKPKNASKENSSAPDLQKAIWVFLFISALYGVATGLSDSVLANYFKEAYNVDAQQRGFIEFPRELPGVLSFFVIAAVASLGIIKSARISAALFFAGITTLAFIRPGFPVMLVILFVYSLGMHMFMPINDSIGISLAVKGQTGKMLGKFKSTTMAFTALAAIVVFFGFRTGVFSFDPPIVVFVLSGVAALGIIALCTNMRKTLPADIQLVQKGAPSSFAQRLKDNLVIRKEYARYYVICALFGGRKQIMFVFSPWVLIDLLGFRADNMSILAIIGAMIGVFFMPVVGRMIDRYGTKKVMIVEALAFIFIYVAYGGLSRWVNVTTEHGGVIVLAGVGMLLVYLLNIIDKMSAQLAMVRSIYLQSIAIRKEDVMPSLTVGMAIDHIVSIVGSLLCGAVWEIWGPEYVFIIAGTLSLLNLIVASGIKTPPKQLDDELKVV